MPDYNYPQSGGQYPPAAPVYGYPPAAVYGAYPSYYTGIPPLDPRRAAGEKEKKEIKKFALFAALAMLGYIVLQFILIGAVTAFGLMDAYDSDYYFGSGIGILFSIVAVALPFFLAYKLAYRDGSSAFGGFGKTKSPLTAARFVLFGFGACLLASYLTSWFAALVESTGISLPYDDSVPPMTAAGIAVFFLKIAVVPALCEELAIRGCVLQPLRRYGDLFAILVSSAAFSALHANIIQIPFALMAGIALGFVYCKTNSIWVSVAVHFLNNAFSCGCAVLYERYSEAAADRAILIAIGVIASLAILSAILLLIKKKLPLDRTVTALTTGKKVRAFIFQPLFLSMLILFAIFAVAEVFSENLR